MKKQLVIALAVVFLMGCAKFNKNLAWGYRSLHWTKLAGDGVDAGLATWLRNEVKSCLAKHGSKSPGYATCIDPALKLVQAWTGCLNANDKDCAKGVVVILQSSQKTGLEALEAAYHAGKGNITSAVKSSICVVAKFLKTAKEQGVTFGKADSAVAKVLLLAAPICY